MLAAVPVPYSTTFCMIWSATVAMAGFTTCFGFGRDWYSVFPSGVVMLMTGVGATCAPPLARVPYAEAISTVLTSFVPSTAEGTGGSGAAGDVVLVQRR